MNSFILTVRPQPDADMDVACLARRLRGFVRRWGATRRRPFWWIYATQRSCRLRRLPTADPRGAKRLVARLCSTRATTL